FDDPSFSDVNDGDGTVDSGETIELAVTIKNRWGKADPVTVTLAAQAAGAVGPDPFVTWDIDTVGYGAVGNFAEDDNGVIRDPEGLVTGVENPFRFTVSKDAFNNHIIPIKVSISAGNGFGAEDPNALYGFSGSFDLVVQRGRVLPSVIEEDFTMTKDDYWIVEKPVFIPAGVTLEISEGAQVQFWNPDRLGEYPEPNLTVAGTLKVGGSADSPVEFFPAQILPRFQVRIIKDGSDPGGTAYWGFNWGDPQADISLEYFKILNPWCSGINLARHGVVTADDKYVYYQRRNENGANGTQAQWYAESDKVNFKLPYFPLLESRMNLCQFECGRLLHSLRVSINNSVFVLDESLVEPGLNLSQFGGFKGSLSFINNAVLNTYLPNANKGGLQWAGSGDIGGNYWNTQSSELIESLIYDKDDDFALPDLVIEPILTQAPESCWPFVVDCVVSTQLENDVSEVGAEEVTYTVTFNRDMDISIQPKVFFGSDEPYTDFEVLGDWQNARTWVGSFQVNSITGDGYQQIRIQDAISADDAWLVTGKNIGRHRFEIVTSGTEALTLQASGGEGFVDLSWGQDDFELLAGYNLYRGDQRINSSIVPAGTTSFRDTDVEPGQNYDYYFKVVLTDMSESESSNTATGTPLDTIPTVISHSAINSAQPNLALSLAADITDNVSVVGASLFYRLAGNGAEYSSREMVNATGDRFTVTLEGSLLQPPGIEYYLSATDGVSTTYSGRGESPYLIVVDDKPVVTGLTPNRGPASGGTVVQVTGTNFKEDSTVTFGSTPATQVTFVSSTQLEVTTPEHIPKALTVTVTNPGDRVGRLLNGYTFIDDFANIYLSDVTAESGEFVTVPLGVANVSGLASLGVTINYDPTELRFSALTKGEFLQDWVLVSNSTVDGEVRLAAASNGVALSGSGALATIEFQVLGQPGASASLSLSNTSLNGGAIIPSQTIGSVQVEEFVSIAGEVYFHGDSSKPMQGVSLNLEGAGTRSATTDESGQFLIKRLPFSDYKLTYAKADEVNGVSALDAALVLRHAVGLENLTGYGLAAADVNRDGQVLPIDAYGILRHAADIEDISVDAGGSAWGFDPAERTYTNLTENITGQNANAYLLGDVSGSWSSSTQQGGKPVKMGIYSLSDPQNDKTLSRVLLQTGEEPLYGAELTLSYDPALTVTSIKCPESAYVLNTETPGELKIALASASGIAGDQVLVELEFNEAVEESAVSVSQVLLQEGQLIVSDTHEEAAFDRDGDGLLDRDEQNYFRTKPDQADSDGDGWNDGDEVTLNYKPTGAESVPVFETTLSTAYNLDGSFASYQVSFATRSGRTYHIEESSDLQTWTSREGEIVGSGRVEIHQLSDLNEKVFIRVREEAP
ncbi:cohesin domain-containing protein, partial [Akkermansiaceae bacterium]|nr:cohesin domain-containing protein [Akkermansiaceae bacterium]